jgi:hypothetical protein
LGVKLPIDAQTPPLDGNDIRRRFARWRAQVADDRKFVERAYKMAVERDLLRRTKVE